MPYGFWVVVIGVLGLAMGSFSVAAAYRYQAGIAITAPSTCPNCHHPIRWRHNLPVLGWLILRGRCADCQVAISPRYPIAEAVTAALFVAVSLALPNQVASGSSPVSLWIAIAVYLGFAVSSVVLSLIDLATQRLPRAIVGPTFGIGLVGFGLCWWLGGEGWAVLRAVAGAAALYLLYALLHVIRPDGMGRGDVTTAGLAGLFLGWLGWGPLVVGTLSGFVFGGVFAVVLLLTGRARRGSAIPFGPWLLAGAWFGIVLGKPVAQWYLALAGLR